MSDIDLARYRRDERDRSTQNPQGQGMSAFLGRVTSASPAVGTFMMVQPVGVLGDESEGSAGTSTDAGVDDIGVFLVGPGTPATDDEVICQRADYRWIATKSGTTAHTILTITVGGCRNVFGGFLIPQSGVTVVVTQGATTRTGTTNGSGVVSFTLPSGGVWNYSATGVVGRQAVNTGSISVTSGGTTTRTLGLNAATGYMCLFGVTGIPIPQADLTVTDPSGTYTLVWDGNTNPPSFNAGNTTRSVALENFPLCDGVTTTTAPKAVNLSLSLNVAGGVSSGDGALRYSYAAGNGCSGNPSTGGTSTLYPFGPSSITLNSSVPFNATYHFNFGIFGITGTYSATVHE